SATMSVRAWGTCATTIRDSCTLGFISYISAFLFSPTLYAPVLCLLLFLPLSLSLSLPLSLSLSLSFFLHLTLSLTAAPPSPPPPRSPPPPLPLSLLLPLPPWIVQRKTSPRPSPSLF